MNIFLPSLPFLITLLILTIANLVAGVLVAVMHNDFQWSALADFLRVMVVPKIGGWLIAELLRLSINPETVPAEYVVLVGFSGIAYLTAVASIGSKLLENLVTLGVIPKAIADMLGKVGVNAPSPRSN